MVFTRERLVELIDDGTPITKIIREVAANVVDEVLLIEARRFIDERQETLEDGTRRLVLNGSLPSRDVLFPFGSVPVKAPRVLDRKVGEATLSFHYNMLPRYLRRSSDLTELIPWMYLRGLSDSDFKPLFEMVTGYKVKGMSSSTVGKLMNRWTEEFGAWSRRDMTGEKYAYIWGDGVYYKVKGERDHVCQLTLLGVNEDGRKTLVGLGEGYVESADCWQEVLMRLRSQGMEPPKLLIGDGGQGLWAGLARVFPDSARQFCWVHKLKDVKRHLPKSKHVEATRRVRDIYMSEDRAEAAKQMSLLAAALSLKHPQAAATLTKCADGLLGFYDFPAEHWTHIRSTNPIESMFGTLRLRTGKTRGRLGRERLGGLLLKLAQTATANMNGIGHVDKLKLVLAGSRFENGELAGNKD